MPNYRQNACVLVLNDAGQLLLCERADIPGAIQTVQGGIDRGETPEQAARRELEEELGLAPGQYEIIASLPETHAYLWPEELKARWGATRMLVPYDGQEQHFFLARVPSDTAFDLAAHHREFSRVWWGSPHEMLAGAWEYKKPGLMAALRGFGLLP